MENLMFSNHLFVFQCLGILSMPSAVVCPSHYFVSCYIFSYLPQAEERAHVYLSLMPKSKCFYRTSRASYLISNNKFLPHLGVPRYPAFDGWPEETEKMKTHHQSHQIPFKGPNPWLNRLCCPYSASLKQSVSPTHKERDIYAPLVKRDCYHDLFL